MTSRECLSAEAAITAVTPVEFYSFLDNFDLRDGVINLNKTCRQQNIPFFIVSDGMDLYIDYILKKFNLNDIRFFCNHGILSDDGLKIEFPYHNDGCLRCGSCKGNRIREVVGLERGNIEVIFIGDGLSDICAVPESDIIFARGDLLEYCRNHNFTAIEYQNFFDILNWLKDSGRIAG